VKSTVEVELFTRPGCHLCEDMKALLERAGAAAGVGVRLVEVDVSVDPELEARYGNDVPVLFVNGRRAFEHRATEEELKRRLLAEVR
jgi:glutaredoxin